MSLLSSPPSGPIQAASGAASGRLVGVAARAWDRETVNYSSKQHSHSVAESLRWSPHIRRDVCEDPEWVRGRLQLPAAAPLSAWRNALRVPAAGSAETRPLSPGEIRSEHRVEPSHVLSSRVVAVVDPRVDSP